MNHNVHAKIQSMYHSHCIPLGIQLLLMQYLGKTVNTNNTDYSPSPTNRKYQALRRPASWRDGCIDCTESLNIFSVYSETWLCPNAAYNARQPALMACAPRISKCCASQPDQPWAFATANGRPCLVPVLNNSRWRCWRDSLACLRSWLCLEPLNFPLPALGVDNAIIYWFLDIVIISQGPPTPSSPY